MPSNKIFTSDILVIGCGIAGSSAALEAAKRGYRVHIITKAARPEESNTLYAQGGIVSLGTDDRPEILKDDIIRTGDGINNRESVELLVAQGRELVDSILIKELRIPFTRSSEAELDYAQEAGHSRRRILHV